MNEITVKALVDNLGTVTDFVDDFLDSHDCPMKVQMQIDIAIDEIFSNICHYAYGDSGNPIGAIDSAGSGDSADSADSVGEATIRVEFVDADADGPDAHASKADDADADAHAADANARKAIALTFIDEGVPYNPLEKEDPDTTLSAEDRKIGGLGIYMVKKNMDEMEYEYSEGKNILSMKKYI